MRSVSGQSGVEVKAMRAAGILLRAAIDTLYPPQCLACDAPVMEQGALCPTCWPCTPFIDGLACDTCGLPLPGRPEDGPIQCDDCQHTPRPWSHGRAALRYDEIGRKLVLGLKHADRHEVVTPAARWMARAVRPLIRPDTLVAPVPLHRWRLFKRRYNQSALLALAIARMIDRPAVPDLLVRTRATSSQDGRTREGRFVNLQGAISAHPRRTDRLLGRHVLLVDDVMTSGATLACATEACFRAGADDVDVVVLARVERDQ